MDAPGNEGEHGGEAGWSWRFRQGMTKSQKFAVLQKQAESPEKSPASTVGRALVAINQQW